MFLSRAMPSTIRISSAFICFTSSRYSIVQNKNRLDFRGGPLFRRTLEKHLSPHPKLLWMGAALASRMCPGLCNRMGRLVCEAKVHPGRSGFEKVDLSEVDVHRRRRVHYKARRRFHTSDHMLV